MFNNFTKQQLRMIKLTCLQFTLRSNILEEAGCTSFRAIHIYFPISSRVTDSITRESPMITSSERKSLIFDHQPSKGNWLLEQIHVYVILSISLLTICRASSLLFDANLVLGISALMFRISYQFELYEKMISI